MIKAAFLDKDGTIVCNKDYPKIIPTNKLLKNIEKGLKYLISKDYLLIIISNQPWIAKNKLTKKNVEKIFQNLIQKLSEKEIQITDYFYCPHQSSDKCKCKKPFTKLILNAINKHDINLKESIVIGDSYQDILMGQKLSLKTILIENPNLKFNPKEKEIQQNLKPDFKIKNLNDIKKIL